MQLADNEALARALESGQTQEVSFSLMFDWDRDGNYATEYADFSDVIVDATLDAQFTGNYPAELEVNDGYAQRQLSVTVQGDVAGVNVVSLFSPFSGSYFGQWGATNTPCYFDVTYMTDDGPVSIRQFTGYVILAQPSRKDATVQLTLADITSQLTAEAQLYPHARAQDLATYVGSSNPAVNTAVQQRGGILLSWYMLHLLRQNGLYQGPKPPPNCLSYFTLAGGPLPEVGSLAQMPRDGRQCYPIADAAGTTIMSAFWQSFWEMPTYRRAPYDYVAKDWDGSSGTPQGSLQHWIQDSAPTKPDGSVDKSAPLTQANFYVAESAGLIGSSYSTDIDVPETAPGDLWEDGPYGPTMKRLSSAPLSGQSGDFLYGVSPYMWVNSWTSVGFNPYPSTSTNRNRVYFGGWQKFDSSWTSDAVTSFQMYLTGLAAFNEGSKPFPYPASGNPANYPVPNHDAAYVYFNAYTSKHGTKGTLEAFVNWHGHDGVMGNTSAKTWRVQSGSAMPLGNGWHYVGCCVEFGRSSVPSFTFNIDGTEYAGIATSDSNTTAMATSDLGVYAKVNKEDKVSARTVETSQITLITAGGASHWGAWYEYGKATTDSKTWSNSPACMDYEVTTDIGTSLARTMWTPDTRGKSAWDVLKDVGSSDLGVIYTDEYGKVFYKNREEIKSLEASDSVSSELTLDEVQDVNPYTTLDSVRNRVTFTSQEKYFVDTAVFKSQSVNDFLVGGGTPNNGNIGAYYLTVDDAMSVLPGRVTPRRLAQGYWSPTSGSLDNPLTTWLPTSDNDYGPQFKAQDFMDSYGPDKWKNGYESHNYGDKTPGGQPLEGLGVDVAVAIGWDDTDKDPRHITVYFYDDGGRVTALAIDDTTPFLNIRGYQITDGGSFKSTVYASDTSSVATFGSRMLERAQTDWSSDYQTQLAVSQSLVDDLANPRPVFDSLDVIGDPRRQLQDVIRVVDTEQYGSIGGPIYGAVVGINRKYSQSEGVTETLTLRQIKNRTGAWKLGTPGLSELGQTTILGSEADG